MSLISRGLYILFAFAVIYLSSCSDDDDSQAVNNTVNITSIQPPSPADLVFYESAATNDRVTITYDYNISHPDGGRIWVQPYANGSISDDYLYSQSSVYNGSGSRTVLISIADEGQTTDVHVDQLRVVISDPDQTMDLFEEFVDVDYTFSY